MFRESTLHLPQVVGPVTEMDRHFRGFHNVAILTHDAVHVTHLRIFGGAYYDERFDNFFIDDDGGVVLGDFGTAWALLDEDGVELRLT